MIFLHLHRTGGSTIWHSLAHAGVRQNMRVLDLYYDSFLKFGNPYDSVTTLSDVRDAEPETQWRSDSVLIHHHTRQNIEELLPVEGRYYTTLLRDPVDRFVSEIFHFRKLLKNGNEYPDEFPLFAGEQEWYRKAFGEDLYQLYIKPDVDPDELVLEASRSPYYKDFYFNFFWSVLVARESPIHPQYYSGKIDDQARLKLVSEIKARFLYIGMYPGLNQALKSIAFLQDIELDPEVDLVHVKNGSVKPSLRPETLEKLRVSNEDEYRLLSMLEVAGPIQSSYERGWSLQRAERFLTQELVRIDQRVNSLEEALAHKEQQVKHLEESVSRLDEERHSLIVDCHGFKGKIEDLLNSTSWRITMPLRAVKTFFR